MTSNLDLLKNELDRLNAFSTPLPKFLLDLADTIPNNRIDSKMKLTIAVSEVILFASQFRRNILHLLMLLLFVSQLVVQVKIVVLML